MPFPVHLTTVYLFLWHCIPLYLHLRPTIFKACETKASVQHKVIVIHIFIFSKPRLRESEIEALAQSTGV